MLKHVTVADICKALVVFDELTADSLVVSSRRKDDDLVEKYSLFTKSAVVTFDWQLHNYEIELLLYSNICELAKREEVDTKLPNMFTKRTHSDVYGEKFVFGGKKQVSEINAYTRDMFKATVGDYGTRFASLDVLKLTPERIVKALAERRVAAEGGSLCEITTSTPTTKLSVGGSSSLGTSPPSKTHVEREEEEELSDPGYESVPLGDSSDDDSHS